MSDTVRKIFTLLLILVTLPCWSYSSVWRITKNNQHIYIGGSLHILPASAYPLPQGFDTAYQASDLLVLETAVPEAGDIKFQQLLKQTVSLAPGQQLSDILTQQTLQTLTAYLEDAGVKLSAVQQFKPGFVATLLAKLAAQKAKLAGTGVDLYFEQMAKSDSKAISYLESAEFQLKLVAQLGQDNPDRFIKDSLSHLADFQTNFNQMLVAWQNGDSQILEKLIIEPMKSGDAKLFKLMMTDRNNQWLTKIEAMFNDSQIAFVLVGAGHLVGEQSVLQLLANRGYQVRQLTGSAH